MSEFMKRFNAGGGNGQRRGPLQTNICLQISGHDLTAPNGGVVQGVVVAPPWLEGDRVQVRLTNEAESVATFRKDRSAAENQKFFRTRPTIEKLVNGYKVGRNDVPPMIEGGYLMLYSATKDHDATVEGQPQVWKAQYADNFGNDPSYSVRHAFTRVRVEEATEKTPARGSVEMLFPSDARLINTIDELRGFYADCMDGQLHGVEHNANAVLRLIAPGGEVKTFMTYSARQEVQIQDADGNPLTVKVPASHEQTWKEAVVDGAQAKGGVKLIAAALSGNFEGLQGKEADLAKQLAGEFQRGEVKLEAIPGRRVPLVGASLEWALEPGNKLERQAKRCLAKVEDGQNPGQTRTVPGFVAMTVSLITMPPRAEGMPERQIIAKFAADEFAKARTVSYIPTENVKTQYSQERDLKSAEASAAAAEKGGIAASSYEPPEVPDHEAELEAAESQALAAPGM